MFRLTVLLVAGACGGESYELADPDEFNSHEATSSPNECFGQNECRAEGSHCVLFDRHGETPKAKAAKPFLSNVAYCVPQCETDATCPQGFSCKGTHSVVEMVRQGGSMRRKESAFAVCAPIAQYGQKALGQSCPADTRCAKASPFCVSGLCTYRCGGECPEGYACDYVEMQMARSVTTQRMCLPRKKL